MRVPVDRVVAGVLVLAVSTLGAVVLHAEETSRHAARAVVQVVDERWRPVADAVVTPVRRGDGAVTDRAGQARLRAAHPVLVRVRANGHLSRTLAVAPGQTSVAVLTRQTARTLSVRFGGDVMFGRRFYDRNEDGRTSDALLAQDATVADHERLLRPVEPLLSDSDLTVVNLETPLRDNPWFDPTGPRPAGWHATKEYVFASSPRSVRALQRAGVDVVSLGNNHVYDALRPGLESTLRALKAAGMPYFGAGRTQAAAWRPAIVRRHGQTVAFLGCTTITGTEHTVDYVAGPGKGGAARCAADHLQAAVTAARERADVVAVMIHGGNEYQATPTSVVASLSDVARDAGARIVVDGHPHVVGSVRLTDGSMTADTMGNLLFDQTVWPTFLSYLLRADVRAGRVVSATTDPLFIRAYQPRPVVGEVADAAARRSAGLDAASSGGALLAPGSTAGPLPRLATRRLRVPAGAPTRLPPGWWLSEPTPTTRVGEDLLWTGGFEDEDTDPATEGGAGWHWSPSARLDNGSACHGRTGLLLQRGSLSRQDAVLTPQHRQLTPPGQQLTLTVGVRRATAGASLELRLYADTEGPSSDSTSVPIPPRRAGPGCTTVRLDMTVPPGIVAVQPYVRVAPPRSRQTEAQVGVDDVRLTAWSSSQSAGPRWDVVESPTTTTLGLVGPPVD